MRRERIGVLGGTFDPVHIGHVVVAAEIRAPCGLDRVLLVVAGDPWQKRGKVVAHGRRPARARRRRGRRDRGRRGVARSRSSASGASVTADTLEALHGPGSRAVPGARRRCGRQHGHVAPPRRDPPPRRRRGRRAGRRPRGPAPGRRVAGRPGVDPSPRHLVHRPAGPPGAGRPIDGLVPPAVVTRDPPAGPLHWRG